MSMSGTHYTLHACLKYDEICIEERRQDRDGLLAHNDAVQLDEIQERFLQTTMPLITQTPIILPPEWLDSFRLYHFLLADATFSLLTLGAHAQRGLL